MAGQGAKKRVLGDATSDWRQDLGSGSGGSAEEETSSSNLTILILIVAACFGLYYYFYMSSMNMNMNNTSGQRLTEEERRRQREQMAMAAAARAKKNDNWQQEQRTSMDTTEAPEEEVEGKVIQQSPPKKVKLTMDSVSSKVCATGEPEKHQPLMQKPTVEDPKPAPLTKRTKAIEEQPAKKEALATMNMQPTVPSLQDYPGSECNSSTASGGPLLDDISSVSVDKEAHLHVPTTESSSSRHSRNETLLPVETAAGTGISTDVTAAVPKKPKRKKLVFPPPQILCEALSTVFKCQVAVESRVEDGTWGGEGWRKRPPSCHYSSNATTIVTLKLPTPQTGMGDNNNNDDDDKEEEWKALSHVFPTVLKASLSSSSGSKLLSNNDIRKAAQYHAEAKGVAKNGFTLLMKGDDGFQELKICMNIVCQWLVQQVETWIRPEVLRNVDNDNEGGDDNDDDLFSSDYNTDSIPSAGALDTGGKVDALFGLLEESVPVVTSDFLEDLFRCHERVGGEQGVSRPLCAYFWNKVLHRLAAAQNVKVFSCPTVTRRIFGMSNLLSASPSVCEYLAQSLQNELGQFKQGKNGKEIQELIRLAPLFEAVAYSVPAAGTEAKPSSIPGGFYQQLDLIENFPISVFRSQKGDSAGQVMSESRRAIKAARTTAELVLRMAFKAGDKETVFQWLGSIASSK
jgi:hypothetical protein